MARKDEDDLLMDDELAAAFLDEDEPAPVEDAEQSEPE